MIPMVEKFRSRLAELARHAHKRNASEVRVREKPDLRPAFHQEIGSLDWENNASEYGFAFARYIVNAVPTSLPKPVANSRAIATWDVVSFSPWNRKSRRLANKKNGHSRAAHSK